MSCHWYVTNFTATARSWVEDFYSAYRTTINSTISSYSTNSENSCMQTFCRYILKVWCDCFTLSWCCTSCRSSPLDCPPPVQWRISRISIWGRISLCESGDEKKKVDGRDHDDGLLQCGWFEIARLFISDDGEPDGDCTNSLGLKTRKFQNVMIITFKL